MPRTTSYDPQCLELAEYFLERPDSIKGAIDVDRAHRLAQRFQETAEAFLEDEAEDAKEAGR